MGRRSRRTNESAQAADADTSATFPAGIEPPRISPLWSIVLVVAALAARLAFILATRESDPFFRELVMDEKVHWDWATEILRSGTLEGVFFRPPLYYYLLAGFRAVTGDSILLCRLLSSLFGIGASLVAFRLARRVAPTPLAFAVALVHALAIESIYDDTRLLTDSLASLLAIGALAVAVERPRSPGLFGLLAGLSEITRGVAAVLFPVWLFLELARARREEGIRSGAGRIARRFALAVGVFALTLVPTAAINAWKGHDFLPVGWNAGVNFHIGNNPKSDGMTAVEWSFRKDWWGSYYDFIRVAEEKSGRKLRPSEVNAYWFRSGLSFWRDEPAAAVRLLAKKARLFVSGVEISNNLPISPEIATGGAVFANWPIRIRWLLPFLLPAASLLLLRNRPLELRAAGLLALAYAGLIVLVFVTSRYRIPVYPPLVVVGAGSLALLARGEAGRGVGERIALGLALAVGVALQFSFVLPPSQVAFDTAVGNIRLQKGNLAEASAAFRRAEAIDPIFPQVSEGLGMVAEAEKRPADALPFYRRELESNGSVYSRYRIAAILYGEGKHAEVVEVSAPLVDRFEDASILHAKSLIALGRYAEAESLLKRNLSRDFAKGDSEYLLVLLAVMRDDPAADAAIAAHRGDERYERLVLLRDERRGAVGRRPPTPPR